jgi:hypothetical protein
VRELARLAHRQHDHLTGALAEPLKHASKDRTGRRNGLCPASRDRPRFATEPGAVHACWLGRRARSHVVVRPTTTATIGSGHHQCSQRAPNP